MQHGKTSGEVPIEVFFGPDKDLALVTGDLHAWNESHPCDCHALCTCEQQEGT